MNKLSTADRVRVISALVEGCSIRSTVRMTGVAKNTVIKLLVEIGEACKAYHDEHVCHLLTKRVQCDEIWAFCYAKQKNVPADKKGIRRRRYLDVDGDRCRYKTHHQLHGRPTRWRHTPMSLCRMSQADSPARYNLTTDGLRVYLDAVEEPLAATLTTPSL